MINCTDQRFFDLATLLECVNGSSDFLGLLAPAGLHEDCSRFLELLQGSRRCKLLGAHSHHGLFQIPGSEMNFQLSLDYRVPAALYLSTVIYELHHCVSPQDFLPA